MSDPCPFCERLEEGPLVAATANACAFRDAFPVSEGHTLIVPRRHEGDLFSLTQDERRDVLNLIDSIRRELDQELRPDGFNVGVNAGTAAGQTVDHAHVHVIPRFAGDVADPRGGVRWVVPERAAYWSP